MGSNNALVQARKDKKWSQQEVAKRVGVDVRTYARWEQREAMPRLSSLRELCKVFQMTPDQLGFDLMAIQAQEG
jgi:transcriptional regulator with XRE-family HTH domain